MKDQTDKIYLSIYLLLEDFLHTITSFMPQQFLSVSRQGPCLTRALSESSVESW